MSGHQSYIVAYAQVHTSMNGLEMTIDCILGRDPREACYKLCKYTCTHSVGYS